MLPFLAGFFEPLTCERPGPSLGTETGTRATEDPDTDEDLSHRFSAPSRALGTRTVTEVRQEETDADIHARMPVLGTQTMTKVANEEPDTDPGVDQLTMWEASIL